MCPTSSELLYDCPTLDIGYPIELDRRTASDMCIGLEMHGGFVYV